MVWFLFSSDRTVSILVIKLACAAHTLYCPSPKVSVIFTVFTFANGKCVCCSSPGQYSLACASTYKHSPIGRERRLLGQHAMQT